MRHEDNLKNDEFAMGLKTGQWDQAEDDRIHQSIVQGLGRSVFKTDRLIVTVRDGVVFASGELESDRAREKITEFISQVKGVRDVKFHVGIIH